MRAHYLTAATSIFLMMTASLLSVQNAGAWGRFDGGHAPPRRDPVIVHNVYVHHDDHHYAGGGCVGCGVGLAAVAGLAAGVIVGSALSAQPVAPPPQTVIVEAPPVGTEYAGLPPGCQSMVVNGANYYQCGPTWYQPFVGGNGVYYSVVPMP
jgi:hypothetical protein